MSSEIGDRLSSYERYLREFEDAFHREDYPTARRYLLLATENLFEVAKLTEDEGLRASRIRLAESHLAEADKIDILARRPRAVLTGKVDDGDDGDGGKAPAPARKPGINFDDIAGLDEVKRLVQDRLINPFLFPEEAKELGVKPGGGILLYGPPGTGKTTFARAIAGELDAPLYSVLASDILSKWAGEAEKNVKELFASAREHERSVIFVDEIEGLAAERGIVDHQHQRTLVNQILAEIQGFEEHKNAMLVIGATNHPALLDRAILRPGRFDELIYVPLPDYEARRHLWRLNLSKRKHAGSFSYDRLAELSEGYSGAEIAYICDEAARRVLGRRARASGDDEASVELAMENVLELMDPVAPRTTQADLDELEDFAGKYDRNRAEGRSASPAPGGRDRAKERARSPGDARPAPDAPPAPPLPGTPSGAPPEGGPAGDEDDGAATARAILDGYPFLAESTRHNLMEEAKTGTQAARGENREYDWAALEKKAVEAYFAEYASSLPEEQCSSLGPEVAEVSEVNVAGLERVRKKVVDAVGELVFARAVDEVIDAMPKLRPALGRKLRRKAKRRLRPPYPWSFLQATLHAEVGQLRNAVERYYEEQKRKEEKDEHKDAVGNVGDLVLDYCPVDFDDVAGMDGIKREIARAIERPIEDYDVILQQTGRPPENSGILLYGPGGCGKTFIALAAAGEFKQRYRDMSVISVPLQAVKGLYHTKVVQRIVDIFELARENAPSIVIWDEFDTYAADPVVTGRKYDEKVCTTFKQQFRVASGSSSMDTRRGEGMARWGKPVVHIATSNYPWKMEIPLLRPGRLGDHFYVPPPDATARHDIFEMMSADAKIAPDLDYERLAEITEGAVAAEIMAAVKVALQTPYDEWVDDGRVGGVEAIRPASMQDFQAACESQTRAQFPSWLRLAAHELERPRLAHMKGMFADLRKALARH